MALPLPSGASSSKGKKQPGPSETLVFDLEIFDPHGDKYPSFDYADLVRQKTGNTDELENPFQENEEHRKLVQLAKRFDEKYGQGPTGSKNGKKMRFGRPEDHLDLGIGYDKEDSFIDDSEAYDELVPSTLTTEGRGFYINSGLLTFKEASDEDVDEESGPSGTTSATVKRKIRIESDSEEDDDDDDLSSSKTAKATDFANISSTPSSTPQKKKAKSQLPNGEMKPKRPVGRPRKTDKAQPSPNQDTAARIKKKTLARQQLVKKTPVQTSDSCDKRISDVVGEVARGGGQTTATPETRPVSDVGATIDGILRGIEQPFLQSSSQPPDVSLLENFIFSADEDRAISPATGPRTPTQPVPKSSSEMGSESPAKPSNKTPSSMMSSPETEKNGSSSSPAEAKEVVERRMVGRPPTASKSPRTPSAPSTSSEPGMLDPRISKLIEEFKKHCYGSGVKTRLTAEHDEVSSRLWKMCDFCGLNQRQRSDIFVVLASAAGVGKSTLYNRIKKELAGNRNRKSQSSDTRKKEEKVKQLLEEQVKQREEAKALLTKEQLATDRAKQDQLFHVLNQQQKFALAAAVSTASSPTKSSAEADKMSVKKTTPKQGHVSQQQPSPISSAGLSPSKSMARTCFVSSPIAMPSPVVSVISSTSAGLRLPTTSSTALPSGPPSVIATPSTSLLPPVNPKQQWSARYATTIAGGTVPTWATPTGRPLPSAGQAPKSKPQTLSHVKKEPGIDHSVAHLVGASGQPSSSPTGVSRPSPSKVSFKTSPTAIKLSPRSPASTEMGTSLASASVSSSSLHGLHPTTSPQLLHEAFLHLNNIYQRAKEAPSSSNFFTVDGPTSGRFPGYTSTPRSQLQLPPQPTGFFPQVSYQSMGFPPGTTISPTHQRQQQHLLLGSNRSANRGSHRGRPAHPPNS